MMQRACAGLMVAVVALCPAVFAAEKVTEIDASGGKSTGHWVIFLSKGAAANAPIGTAAAVVGHGDSIEGAFGMNVQGGKPVASAISADVVKAERASEKEPGAITLIVKVTADQHAAVKKIIETWSAIAEHNDAPNDVAVNFAQEVIDALGMKRAYRTGLAPVNPIQYFGDLAVVNRKMGQKTT